MFATALSWAPQLFVSSLHLCAFAFPFPFAVLPYFCFWATTLPMRPRPTFPPPSPAPCGSFLFCLSRFVFFLLVRLGAVSALRAWCPLPVRSCACRTSSLGSKSVCSSLAHRRPFKARLWRLLGVTEFLPTSRPASPLPAALFPLTACGFHLLAVSLGGLWACGLAFPFWSSPVRGWASLLAVPSFLSYLRPFLVFLNAFLLLPWPCTPAPLLASFHCSFYLVLAPCGFCSLQDAPSFRPSRFP